MRFLIEGFYTTIWGTYTTWHMVFLKSWKHSATRHRTLDSDEVTTRNPIELNWTELWRVIRGRSASQKQTPLDAEWPDSKIQALWSWRSPRPILLMTWRDSVFQTRNSCQNSTFSTGQYSGHNASFFPQSQDTCFCSQLFTWGWGRGHSYQFRP